MATRMDDFKQNARRLGRRTLWFISILLVVAAAGYFIWRTYTISEGSRTGTLYKLSRRGVVFKTYEGELQLAGTDMMTQLSVWTFSVKNGTVADQLHQFEGKAVTCYYRELVDAFPWQGDTDYIVYKVEAANR